jgi:SPP1 gp7 family putative phage head morphogenesis protein
MTLLSEDQDESATESLAGEMILLALLLLRFSAHLRLSAEARMAALRADVLAQMAPLDLTGPERYVLADRLSVIVLDLTRTAYRDIHAMIRAELVALAALISTFIAARIGDELGVPGAGRQVPPEVREQSATGAVIVGATLAAWLSRMAGDAHFRVERVITDAATNSLGPTEVVRGIGTALDQATRSLKPIIRTAVTAVSADVTIKATEANREVMAGWSHVSVLDGSTTELCKSRAGRRWDMDHRPVGHTMAFRIPPLHMGCRSHLSPWFRPVAEMPGNIRDGIERAGRGRAFGSRPAIEPTLEEWLRRRPIAEQRMILGEKQLKEWRASRITVAGLLDQSGRPLTLDQVRKALGL